MNTLYLKLRGFAKIHTGGTTELCWIVGFIPDSGRLPLVRASDNIKGAKTIIIHIAYFWQTGKLPPFSPSTRSSQTPKTTTERETNLIWTHLIIYHIYRNDIKLAVNVKIVIIIWLFRLNLETKEVDVADYENALNNDLINAFDFPFINHQYNGIKHRYTVHLGNL